MFQLMLDRMAAGAYEHYEISNFCLHGYASRHNTKYWRGEAVYGFGCSAHSFDGERRRWSNERDAARYTSLVEAGGATVVETLELDEREAAAEAVFLGLRLMQGLSISEHRERFGKDLYAEYAAELSRLSEANLVSIEDDRLRLTRHGALLSNEVFAVFV
jgi:oxygen-independent coproporphyrinogen-3 oxidase